MLQSIIEVSLQGSDVAADLNIMETYHGLHLYILLQSQLKMRLLSMLCLLNLCQKQAS